MLLIPCPWCGERHEQEFSYGGSAEVNMPAPEDGDQRDAWVAYVYERENPAGTFEELWHHSYGCGKWIRLKRDSRTNKFIVEGANNGV